MSTAVGRQVDKSTGRQVDRSTSRQISMSSIYKWRWGSRSTGSLLLSTGNRSTGPQVDKSVLIICIHVNGCVGISQAEIQGLNA